MNRTKSWFFEKINRIHKLIAQLIRGQTECVQINKKKKKRIEKGDITEESEKIKKVIRSSYRILYSTKLENLEKNGNILEKYQVPKLNQEQKNRLKKTITAKELKPNTKNLPTKKSQVSDGFCAKIYPEFVEIFIAILSKLFHQIETDGALPNSFYDLML